MGSLLDGADTCADERFLASWLHGQWEPRGLHL